MSRNEKALHISTGQNSSNGKPIFKIRSESVKVQGYQPYQFSGTPNSQAAAIRSNPKKSQYDTVNRLLETQIDTMLKQNPPAAAVISDDYLNAGNLMKEYLNTQTTGQQSKKNIQNPNSNQKKQFTTINYNT
jgi:hypothetical protein